MYSTEKFPLFSSLISYRPEQSGEVNTFREECPHMDIFCPSMKFSLITLFPKLGLNVEIYSANLCESPKLIYPQCTLSLSPKNIRKPSGGRERVHWDQMG